MDSCAFVDQENWLGSFYELAIEYAPFGDNERLLTAQQALWRAPSLEGPLAGPYVARDDAPEAAFRPGSLPTSIGPHDTCHLYGVLHLPRDRALGVLSVVVRESDRSDWLDFCVPTGMLHLVYPHVHYPLERAANPWMDELDHVFLALADTVYAVSPFRFALVGEEVSGAYTAGELSPHHLPEGGFLASQDVVERLHPEGPSVVLPSGLSWFPSRSRFA